MESDDGVIDLTLLTNASLDLKSSKGVSNKVSSSELMHVDISISNLQQQRESSSRSLNDTSVSPRLNSPTVKKLAACSRDISPPRSKLKDSCYSSPNNSPKSRRPPISPRSRSRSPLPTESDENSLGKSSCHGHSPSKQQSSDDNNHRRRRRVGTVEDGLGKGSWHGPVRSSALQSPIHDDGTSRRRRRSSRDSGGGSLDRGSWHGPSRSGSQSNDSTNRYRRRHRSTSDDDDNKGSLGRGSEHGPSRSRSETTDSDNNMRRRQRSSTSGDDGGGGSLDKGSWHGPVRSRPLHLENHNSGSNRRRNRSTGEGGSSCLDKGSWHGPIRRSSTEQGDGKKSYTTIIMTPVRKGRRDDMGRSLSPNRRTGGKLSAGSWHGPHRRNRGQFESEADARGNKVGESSDESDDSFAQDDDFGLISDPVAPSTASTNNGTPHCDGKITINNMDMAMKEGADKPSDANITTVTKHPSSTAEERSTKKRSSSRDRRATTRSRSSSRDRRSTSHGGSRSSSKDRRARKSNAANEILSPSGKIAKVAEAGADHNGVLKTADRINEGISEPNSRRSRSRDRHTRRDGESRRRLKVNSSCSEDDNLSIDKETAEDSKKSTESAAHSLGSGSGLEAKTKTERRSRSKTRSRRNKAGDSSELESQKDDEKSQVSKSSTIAEEMKKKKEKSKVRARSKERRSSKKSSNESTNDNCGNESLSMSSESKADSKVRSSSRERRRSTRKRDKSSRSLDVDTQSRSDDSENASQRKDSKTKSRSGKRSGTSRKREISKAEGETADKSGDGMGVRDSIESPDPSFDCDPFRPSSILDFDAVDWDANDKVSKAVVLEMVTECDNEESNETPTKQIGHSGTPGDDKPLASIKRRSSSADSDTKDSNHRRISLRSMASDCDDLSDEDSSPMKRRPSRKIRFSGSRRVTTRSSKMGKTMCAKGTIHEESHDGKTDISQSTDGETASMSDDYDSRVGRRR